MLLRDVSYYQTGGSCEQWIAPNSVAELAEEMARIRRDRTPYFLLGAGSNALIMDEHWPGAVIMFNRLQGLTLNNGRVLAEAGVENTRLAEQCLESSLAGAEWMNCLPGQLGATVRMNARCYEGEISRIVESVTVVTPQGQVKNYRDKAVFRGYKDTIFMSNREVVAAVELKLKPGDREQIAHRMTLCKADREKKHQFDYPSCGCVFKNDYTAGVPSGLLLESVGVKSFSTDLVEISPYHANFLFNKGASARQILDTTFRMREAVYHQFGIWLEYEMEILGVLPNDLKDQVSEMKENKMNEHEIAPLRELFLTKL